MEKKFARMNYYEMLDLKPDATLFEIRHAYNVALQLYQKDSLITGLQLLIIHCRQLREMLQIPMLPGIIW